MSNDDAGKKILDLLADPFSKQLQSTAIWSALGTSLGVTVGIAVTFSFLRPYNQSVYAPKLKHADEKHAPPPIGKKIWSWIPPLWNTGEAELVHHVGMDATVFLRFVRMCIFIFASISVFCIAILIPVYLNNADKQALANRDWIEVITPLAVWGESAYWAQVAVAYLITFTVMGFLWWNYRKVMLLRRNYFQSEEYQNSLHARTLMMYDIPKDRCSDEGIARIVDEVVPDSSFARTAIARNVKDLPNLIEQHDHTVRKLESVLAKYLKKPDQLPAGRPMCKPSKKDPSFSTYPKGQKVDAIEYLTQRIKELETEIKEVRASVDKRSTMPYGFASYSDIAEAHNIAYATRKKHPRGTKISLAPRPNDVIWDNLPLSAANRRWRRFINNVWIAVLTVVWIVPNAMIAIFLINFQNLGSVWPAFKTELATNPTFWAIVQGIASPAIMSLVYLVLPMIFRQLSMKAGDQTKTGRERHVLAKLYAFFVFNNLIVFSLFGTIWQLVAAVVKETSDNQDAWKAIIDADIAAAVFAALCQVSPYWVTWLLQRQLGAAIDLAQLWKLVYSFFPLVLPAATLYYAIDYWLKKYLLLYTFVTKTESGGMFWRVLFNRFLFAVFVSHCTFFLGAWARSDWAYHSVAIAIIPLPIILIIFKIVCARMFDNKTHYYSTTNVRKHPEAGVQKEQRLRSERLASRFGHPALEGGPGDVMSMSGYSDAYVLDPMSKGRPGKSAGGVPGFEFVSESHMDFEYYKNRAEFAEEHGQGDIFGRNPDIIRPGTPGSMTDPATPANGGFQAFTPPSGYQSPNTGRMSPTGGLPTPQAAFAQQSTYGDRSRSPLYNMDNGSLGSRALGGGPRGYSGLRQDDAETPEQDPSSYDYFRGSRRRNDNNGW
uniref:Duf221 domain-containing protein n=1 Tax=Colletotrichum fructicola (strain Nara gc5) TaxID=1213859 RepID=L2FFZ3_COLFN